MPRRDRPYHAVGRHVLLSSPCDSRALHASRRRDKLTPAMFIHRLRLLPLTAATLGFVTGASAQVYPSRPVTMVVPFPAGGSTDTIARVVAEALRGPLGQTVVIENVGGASGNIAVGRVARAAPDGYTLVMGSWPTHVLNAAIFTLPYDPVADFEPVSLVATQPLLIVARPSMPANNLLEFLAWLKAEPGRATQGTAGSG